MIAAALLVCIGSFYSLGNMASIRIDIISIGTLGRNRLWNESAVVRTAHSTTSLIRVGKRNILVDPGLPAAALGARLHERTGLKPEAIDTIFLTNARPAHRGGLAIFTKAKVLIHEIEQQSFRAQLESLIDQSPEEDIDHAQMEAELKLINSFTPADDKLAQQVDLFPLFGYTAGTCGLLVSTPLTSTLIAGDAVPTLDHFLVGQVLPDSADIKGAQEAMAEVYEIADLVVPGHDNIFVNPRGQGV
jgi:glyoxylase-like metal-dependent hydrolase (beta-lactamase superfamily II)